MYVLRNEGATVELLPTQSIHSGDSLLLGNGTLSVVHSIKFIDAFGLYNPQTMHGNIVVNGVQASTYTTALHPSAAHALLTPLRTADVGCILYDKPTCFMGASVMEKVLKIVGHHVARQHMEIL